MVNKFEMDIIGTKGLERKLVIYEINSKVAKQKELLGTACGIDLAHCVYLAATYSNNFLDRVRYYRINDSHRTLEELRKLQPNSISVEFYADGSEEKQFSILQAIGDNHIGFYHEYEWAA